MLFSIAFKRRSHLFVLLIALGAVVGAHGRAPLRSVAIATGSGAGTTAPQTTGATNLSSIHSFNLKALAQENPTALHIQSESPLGRDALVFDTDATGGNFALPPLKDGVPWSKASFLVFDVWHEMGHCASVKLEFYKQGKAEPQVRVLMGALPRLPTRMVFPMQALDGQTIFLARDPGRLKGVVSGHRLPPEMISKVTFGLGPGPEAQKVWISAMYLSKARPSEFPSGAPVVDEFGQWAVKSWPGKIQSEAELKQRNQQILEKARSAKFPEDWSQYGGWKAKQFKATGFFRTQHDGKRWWLVDPGGYTFYSVGVDGVGPYSSGPTAGMDGLFESIPPTTGRLTAAAARSPIAGVSFVTANLIRAFGEGWRTSWGEMARGLLQQWRFNTIGNWSEKSFTQEARLPYVIPLERFPSTAVLLYRDFPDVFDPKYAEEAVRFAQQLVSVKNDPYLLGYFLRNEPQWAFGNNNLASEMLATATPSFTRSALVEWLKDRYKGNAAGLSAAWKRPFAKFEELEKMPILDADSLSASAAEDLRAFSAIMVGRYIRLVSEAVRKVDPNHLNLGMRYASISSELCYQVGQYFDVFSINSYRMKPPADVIAEITRRTGKPVMIGEFHFGALDRGLPSTGLRGVASQAERGVAYRFYVEQGAQLAELVGMHYFIWNDQPVLGRFDGENYNIGVVDVAHLPYQELVQAATVTNERIYKVAAGESKAFDTPAKEIPRVAF